jgi:hypothetical protein
MAKTTGTADNYLDLMTDFRDFITGLSPTISWLTVRDTSTSPVGANSPNVTEMIFEGDASNGGSPQRKLYFGMKTYETPASSIFGWELRGFTGFQDGSPVGSVAFEDQPDASKGVFIPLQNTSMTYWIWANERRVIMVVKTGTAYQWFHAGFLDTFSTETEYPYPLMVMGSSYKNTVAFNSNALDFSTIIDPAGDLTEAPILNALSCMYVRFVDGQWYPIKNFNGTTSASDLRDRCVWPLAPFNSADWPEDGAPPAAMREFRQAYYATTQGGTPVALLAQTPGSPDDISPMYPLTIIWNEPSVQLIGEISGVFWVNSSGGLTAEDEIFDNGISPAQRYLVFQNVHRTDAWEFAAVKDA